MAYKSSVKDLIELCQETLVGSNYDKFWVEGQQRKMLKTREQVETLAEKLREIKARDDLDNAGKISAFEGYLEQRTQEENADKAAMRAREEEKKSKEVTIVEDSNWSKEDIANLTKAIVRFPPGTNQRWKVIADFCGMKNQKLVIKKAQELA